MSSVTKCPGCHRYASPFDIVSIKPNLKCYIGRQTGLVICGTFYSFYVLETEDDAYFRTRASLKCRSCGFEFDEVTEGPIERWAQGPWKHERL